MTATLTRASSTDSFQPGEPILLRRTSRESWLLPLVAGSQTVAGAGVVDLTEIVGKSPGVRFSWTGREYRVLRPSLSDLLAHLHRRAQIVTPKDAMYLLYLSGVSPGRTVVEAGSGSGALTIVLAHAVGPQGRVISYDRRTDFSNVARQNVLSAGLADRVEFRVQDVESEGFNERNVDSIVLDLPQPWNVLPAARSALVPGGYVAAYTPTYNQLEQTVRAARAEKFAEIRSVELIERALHVGEGGTRPEFEMLGHTGFLTGARRVD